LGPNHKELDLPKLHLQRNGSNVEVFLHIGFSLYFEQELEVGGACMSEVLHKVVSNQKKSQFHFQKESYWWF
jgi:hypothetical protein